MERRSVPATSTSLRAGYITERIEWAVVLSLVSAMLAMVLIPVYLIQPFRPQTLTGLDVAYTLRRWAPPVTLAGSGVTLVLCGLMWRRAQGWWRKPMLIVAFMISVGATWFTRQNHFEWMFNPLPRPTFAMTNEASFMAEDDMVMAVELNGEAVAYPVRQIAYHHLVQDVVGGTPIAATY